MGNRSWIWGMAIATALVIVAAFGFSFFNRPVTAESGEQPVILHYGNGAEPSSLDPHRMTGVWESRILGDLMVGLYTPTADNTAIFGAAEAHEISEDGLTHTFTIREGHTWSDGTPLTAYDFEYSFRRMVNPETAAEFASFHYVIENAREINFGEIDDLTQLGVRALDERTLEVRLVRPHPYLHDLFKSYLFYPVPRHVVEEHGDRWSRPGTMVSNGPYHLVDWVPNDHIHVVRNPYFYDNENVQIDEVVYYPTDDASSALRRFRAGEIDLNTDFPEQQIAWLRDNMPQETHTDPSTCVGYIVTNTEVPPFDDVRVRQALAMTIDREALAEQILSLGETPAYSIVTPHAPGYPAPAPEWAALNGEERVERARALLADAGFSETNRLSFVYRYREGIKNRRAALAVANMWTEIGVDADLVNTEPAIHYDDLRAGRFEVGDAGWCPLLADPAEILLLVHSDFAELNSPNYYNPEYDAPYNEALVTVDAARRNELMAASEVILLRDMPLIPTYYYVNKNLVGPHVQGWVDNPQNAHRTRWLSIDESLRPQQESFTDRVMRWFN